MLTLLALGFLLGVRHAADPDHLVAVSALVSRQRSIRRASSVGALWGLGHSATVVAVGSTIIGFQLIVPPRLILGLEFAVGVALVALGVGNLWRRERQLPGNASGLRALGLGVVHGLAGSAAVVLLVLTTISDPRWAIACLAIFGLGTITGMVAMTATVALPSLYAASHVPKIGSALRIATGSLSVAVGLFLMHEVGVVSGLFSSYPR